MREAKYYKSLEGKRVRCELCPHRCSLAPEKTGICKVRKNVDGKLYTLNYGEVVSIANDPVEKKPLYHFYPGETILSIAANGCNLSCPYCQNWEIAKEITPSRYISPEEMIGITEKYGAFAIAYTYTEPLVWFEYVLDTARIAKEKGIKNVLVTNGTINQEPLEELLPLIDAMNIDLKSSNPTFYKKVVKGNLNTVKNTIEQAYKKGVHIELTNLVIPGENDSLNDFHTITDYVSSLSPAIPLHFSRYFPYRNFPAPPTSITTLLQAYNIARKKLHYVYLGNIWEIEEGSNTYCPECENLLIARRGYYTQIKGIKDKRCSECGRPVDVVM